MKTKIIIFSICLIFSITNAFANVGVGFGTWIFQGFKPQQGVKGKLADLTVVSLNMFSYTSSFAITSGTSGYKEGAPIGLTLVESFVAENMDNLAIDIARGDGQYLDALAHLMEVSNKDSFKNILKNNFNLIYPTKEITSKDVVKNIILVNS